MGMYFSRRLPACARYRSGRCAKSTRRRRVPRRVRPSEIRAFHPGFFVLASSTVAHGSSMVWVCQWSSPPGIPYPLYRSLTAGWHVPRSSAAHAGGAVARHAGALRHPVRHRRHAGEGAAHVDRDGCATRPRTVRHTQWHLPAKRVKGRNDHIIPLPEEAMAILREIEPANTAPTDFVFTGAAAGGRINHQAMRLLLRELGLDYDVHRVRTTFKSWALDNLKHPLDIPAVELALDHAIGGKVARPTATPA